MRLVGELDLVHRARVDAGLAALLATTAPTVVLDLSGLTFVDAHSLHAWRTAGESLARHGRELVVREPTPFIRRLLAETSVVDFVRVEPDPSSARPGLMVSTRRRDG
jgi:anti-anti-sigma factor